MRFPLKCLVLFTVAFAANLAIPVVAKNWGKPMREALQRAVLNDFSDFIRRTTDIVEDPRSQKIERQIAEQNLLSAFRDGVTLKDHSDEDFPFDQIAIVFSVGRSERLNSSHSIEIEFRLKKDDIPIKVTLIKERKTIWAWEQKDLIRHYQDRQDILQGRSESLPQPVPGLYKLSFQTRKGTHHHHVLIDSFPERGSWPPLFKVQMTDKKNLSVVLPTKLQTSGAQMSGFQVSRFQASKVEASNSKEASWILTSLDKNDQRLWMQVYSDFPPLPIVIPRTSTDLWPKGVALSHILKYRWGAVEVVQALNDYVAVDSKQSK